MKVEIRGINHVRKRRADGGIENYYYAWKGGPRLPGKPGSPEFTAAYSEATKSKAALPKGDTLSALLNKFQNSIDFTKLVSTGRSLFLRVIRDVDQRFGEWPLSILTDKRTRGIFKDWRQEVAVTKGLRTADAYWAHLARVLSWGLDRGLVDVNPCAKGGRLWHPGGRLDKIWTTEQEAQFFARAARQFHLPVLLGIWTGQRVGDLLALKWSAYDGTELHVEQSKSRLRGRHTGKPGKRVVIPVSGQLKAALDQAKREALQRATESDIREKRILLSTLQKPWSIKSFASSFGKARVQAGIHGLTFHDLRGTAVVRMAVAGCTVPEIASVSGHSLGEVRSILEVHYLYLDQSLAENAIRKREARENRPTVFPTVLRRSA